MGTALPTGVPVTSAGEKSKSVTPSRLKSCGPPVADPAVSVIVSLPELNGASEARSFGHEVADAQRVVEASPESNRGLAVLPRIPRDAGVRRPVVLVDRRRRRAAWQQRGDQRWLVEIVVERMRVDLIADAVVQREVQLQAPGVFNVARVRVLLWELSSVPGMRMPFLLPSVTLMNG